VVRVAELPRELRVAQAAVAEKMVHFNRAVQVIHLRPLRFKDMTAVEHNLAAQAAVVVAAVQLPWEQQ
jgi:hypothetical protein